MKPFFCYYGGKYRAALKYPAPEHSRIVEPFAGAAGYATRYGDRHRVCLIDKDPIIAGLWKYLTRVSAAEVLALPLLGADQTVDDLGPVPQEARWLVGFWLNKGAAAPMRSPSAWMREGTRPNSYWGSAIRERIAMQVERIRHWHVIEGSYADAPEIEATWFVDPPYAEAGKHYRYRTIDFAHLATWARARKGLTVVCENAGASWLPFEPFATIRANPSKHGGKTSEEVIWTQRVAA